MWCEVTLYKSGFSPSNVFVGNSESDRLSTLRGLPHLTLPRSPYNPNFPYRLSGNLIDFDRKYDYARIAFFKEQSSSAPAYARSYFINRFTYINDEVCDFVGSEDFIGELWANIKFSFCQPNKFTYKESDIIKKDFDINIPENLYIEERDIKELTSPFIIENNKRWYLGGVIVTASVNPSEGLPQNSYAYKENNTLYPVFNILLPFLFDETGTIKSETNTQVEFHINGQIYYPTGLSGLLSLSRKTDNGFQIASTCIDFEAFYLANVSTNNNKFYVANSDDMKFAIEDFETGGSRVYIKEFSGRTITQQYQKKTVTQRRPFERLRVTLNDKEEFFNPYFIGNENTTWSIEISKSLLPPYNHTVRFLRPIYLVGEGPQSETYDYTIILSNDNNYTTFTDGYAEWLRNNYNATITGLKVQQKAAKANLAIKSGAAIVKEAASLDIFGAATASIDAIANAGTLIVNQNAQDKLLALALEDKKNSISQVAFGSSVKSAWQKQGYLRITNEKSIFYDLMISEMNRYGVKTALAIKSTHAHARFDFLQTNDFTLTPINNVYFNDYQRAGITAQLNAGVRLWYTVQDFLNFDIPNPEV